MAKLTIKEYESFISMADNSIVWQSITLNSGNTFEDHTVDISGGNVFIIVNVLSGNAYVKPKSYHQATSTSERSIYGSYNSTASQQAYQADSDSRRTILAFPAIGCNYCHTIRLHPVLNADKDGIANVRLEYFTQDASLKVAAFRPKFGGL